MRTHEIIHGARLKEVLREELQRAFATEAIRTSDEAEFYLVNLLSNYQAAGSLPGLDDHQKPLGILYIEAMTSPAAARVRLLKAIGDTALIAIGFFAESIRRGIMGTDYYAAIGGAAYGALSGAVAADDVFAEVYAELAAKFLLLTAALARLAPWNRPTSDAELFHVYRRWQESGDAQLGEVLRCAGLLA